MKKSSIFRSAVTVVLAGFAMSALAKLPQEIKIGVAGPHTGANAVFGEQLWKGASKAIDDINAAGGINGSKLMAIKADDACEPKQAVAVAQRLVESDKVNAVVGHFCSSSSIPASDVYAPAKILQVTPASTNPNFTERGLKTVFRTCGRDDQQGVVAADWVIDKLKAKRLAVIHDKDTYGQGLADAMKAHYRKRGKREVVYEGLTRGEKDFNALVTKLRQAKVDTVFFGGLHTEAGLLVRQIRDQGLKDVVFISGDGITSDEFPKVAGGTQYTDGVLMTFGADPRLLPEGQAVVKAFRDSGYEPEAYTLYSYAAVQVIAAAMKATQSTDGRVLGDWLRKNGVKTVMGMKDFDAKGDIKVSDYVMYKWDDQGKYTMIK